MPAWDYSQPPATVNGTTPFRLNPTGSPEGGPCFQAGEILDNRISQAQFIAPTAGVLTIGYRVSSEQGYDFLTAKAQFSTTNLFQISGETEWATATVHLAAGEALDVMYTKDGSASNGGDTGWITLAFVSDALTIQGRAALRLTMQGAISGAATPRILQGQAALCLTMTGWLKQRKTIKARAALRLMAKHGMAQPPSGLGMKMTILTDPYRPDVIRDQYLMVWFNGNPNQCKIALQIDDGAEFQPAFTWQNPSVTYPAVIKIDGAEIPGDGQSHLIKVSVWQAIGQSTSARATLSDYAKTPTTRPATQPSWCGVTAIRQGETLYSSPHVISGHISDLTRIEWRHTGAVKIMAKVPVANEKSAGFHDSIISVGYADYDETEFFAEGIGSNIGWRGGDFHDVLFGVAAIHGGQFGPITWASAPVRIKEILNRPADPPQTPDEIAGTIRILDIDGLKDDIIRALFATNGWVYPAYWEASPHRDTAKMAVDRLLLRIKDIIRKGGSVTLDDLGRFEARWNPARTVRSMTFVASAGFIAGTRAGTLLTDQQAKASP
ncbi:MAG: hypothetical protein EKK68_15900 [Candidatus Competibacteraceae bacterium]|nr:MAG: hypothetical protein EKK68_15900 [Candidatus Competibacteraceae bacterium]